MILPVLVTQRAAVTLRQVLAEGLVFMTRSESRVQVCYYLAVPGQEKKDRYLQETPRPFPKAKVNCWLSPASGPLTWLGI